MATDKPILYNLELEEALLGSCQIDPAAFRQASSLVEGGDFYLKKNVWVWRAFDTLAGRGEPIDTVLLLDELERRGQLAELGGSAYITRLINAVPSALHVRDYARRVADLAERRRAVLAASELARAAYTGDGRFRTDKARIAAGLIRDRRGIARAVTAHEAVGGLYERVKFNVEHPLKAGQVRDLSTGMADLDRLLGGLCVGVYVIGAVTHVGKTAFCLAIAANVAAAGGRVLYFSPEMTPDQLMERLVCAQARVSSDDIDSGRIAPEDYARFVDAYGRVADWPLLLSPSSSMQEMQAEVYRHSPLALVVCDGIELITGVRSDKTHEARGEVIRWGLALSQNPDVLAPILIPVQVATKAVKDRRDKRPMPGDLYSSSEPEMGSDVVMTLHREDRWTFNKAMTPDTHALEVFLWKHRLKKRSIPGKVTLRFGDCGEVTDMAPPDVEF